MLKKMLFCILAIPLVVSFSQSAFALGGKDLETEKVAVNFAREMERGGYKIISAEELKGWISSFIAASRNAFAVITARCGR